MWQLVKDLVSGCAAWMRWQANRHEALNSPEMRANARAKQGAKIRDEATDAVKANDLDEIRKQAGE